MNVVAYVRVSTKKQVDEGLGIDVQEKALRRWARDQGHEIAAWERDEGRSGDSDEIDRPGLAAALACVEGGEAQAIAVYRLDRLARRLYRQEMVIHQLRLQGAVVLSVRESDTDSDEPERVMFRQLLGIFAEYERALIRGRMLAGRHAKASKGGYAGFGSPPYGWQAQNKELVPDPEEQGAISLMRRWRAEGHSLRQIAARLDVEGYRPKRGDNWSPTAVQRVLKRPA